MKIRTIRSLFALASFLAMAPSWAGPQHLAMGETFKCSSSSSINGHDRQIATCTVMGDVFSFTSKETVIPAGTRLVGEFSGSAFVWKAWVTPDGVIAQSEEKPLPFYTSLGADSNSALTVMVTSDILLTKAR